MSAFNSRNFLRLVPLGGAMRITIGLLQEKHRVRCKVRSVIESDSFRPETVLCCSGRVVFCADRFRSSHHHLSPPTRLSGSAVPSRYVIGIARDERILTGHCTEYLFRLDSVCAGPARRGWLRNRTQRGARNGGPTKKKHTNKTKNRECHCDPLGSGSVRFGSCEWRPGTHGRRRIRGENILRKSSSPVRGRCEPRTRYCAWDSDRRNVDVKKVSRLLNPTGRTERTNHSFIA